jgi:hypothetical protein
MPRFRVLCAAAVLVALAVPRAAHAQQSVNFFLGGFVPDGAAGRTFDDVLFNEQNYLLFDLGKFKGATVGGEWLVAMGQRVEAGIGVGVYSNGVTSSYGALVNEFGGDIQQELKLRIVPTTATFRVLPLGRKTLIQPYVGGGVGIFWWRYTETGQFVDADSFIFTDRYESSGTETGPVVLGGARVGLGQYDVGFEIRYQSATGTLDPREFGNVASKIDLDGFSYLATFNLRF